MKYILIVFAVAVALSLAVPASAQKKPVKKRPRAIKKVAPAKIDIGKVVGRTYSNTQLGFEVTFPDTWLIPGPDFEAYMKSQGFDLALKPPDSISRTSKQKIAKAIQQVTVLLTAYRSMPGLDNNAIVRISVEDLSANPQIKDAVDYFDAMRTTFTQLKLPADFKYGETMAEKLGEMQFGYLDVDSPAGKKRMYATVRKGYAVMFTISYTELVDLETLRGILEGGSFALK